MRPGESNDELRFSLRSLSNVPHDRVWFVGHKPPWVKNVGWIEGGNSAPHTRANLWRNLTLACAHPDVSEDVLIMNDDIYIVGRVEQVPVLHRGLLAEQIVTVRRNAGTRGWWQDSLATTRDCLAEAGYDDPLSYELHVPFPCSKTLMAQTLDRFAHVTLHNPPQWRTLYGVTHQIGGSQHRDGKAVRPGPIARPYHSTDDMSWRYFRARFIQLFPDASPYERPAANARSLVNVTPRNHLRSTRRIRA